MIRILFSVLAVVAAVLALVLDRPVLYAVAAAMLLIVVIVWMTVAWRRHRTAVHSFKPVTTAPPAPEENLQSLGILEIRPKEPAPRPQPDAEAATPLVKTPLPDEAPLAPTLPDASEAVPAEGPPEPSEAAPVEEILAEETLADSTQEEAEDLLEAEDLSEADLTTQEPADATLAPTEEATASLKEFVLQSAGPDADVQTNGVKPFAPDPHDEAVLGPYLQALRAALNAHTVCLLKQEDIALDYRVVALVNEGGPAPSGHTFSATTPLLTARMAEHGVTTVRPVNAEDLLQSSLGYSDAPEAVRQVALAPVPIQTSPDTYFLLADTPRTDLLNHPRARTLLTQFARLLATLLDSATAVPVSTESPLRPRREIIAEEMEQARARNQVLALAIVYLNQAEDIALAGEAAVAEAEDLLRLRLGHAARTGRVVRFGELTYGVFYDGHLLEVEAWGTQIQEALSEETGLLEGGVSIGIALLQDRHETPDAFRADATEALREAYETGTCTILE